MARRLYAIFYALFLQGALTVTTFATTLLIAQISGDRGFGVYSLVSTWMALLGLIAVWGTDDLVLRHQAQLPSPQRPMLWRFAYGQWGRASLALSLLVLALVPLSAYPYELICALPTAALYALILLAQAQLRANDQITLGQMAEKAWQPLFFAIALLLFWLLNIPLATASLLGWRTASFLFAAVILLYHLRAMLPTRPNTSVPPPPIWHKETRGFLVSTLLYAVLARVDLLVLGFLQVDPASIGHYNLALKLSDLALIPFAAVATVATPRFAAAQTKTELQNTFTYFARLAFAGTLLTALGLWLLSPWLLALYGKSFSTTSHALLGLLLLPKILHAFLGPVQFLLSMRGQTRWLNRLLLINLFLSICTLAFGVPLAGIQGAAWAALLTSLVFELGLFWVAWRALGLRVGLI